MPTDLTSGSSVSEQARGAHVGVGKSTVTANLAAALAVRGKRVGVLDAELRRAADAGTPVVVASPRSASARELTRIAATLPSPRRSLAHPPLPLSVL